MLVVAAATLAGFLAVETIGLAVEEGQEYAAAAPLRPAAVSRSGRIEGLLPPATLHGRSKTTQSRDLRPGAVLLVPYPCECLQRLRHVVAQADGSRVRVYIVGYNGREQVDRLAAAAGRGVVPLLDPRRRLQQAYRPGPQAVLLLVRRDGVVTRIFDGVSPELDLAPLLPALLRVP